MSTIFLVGVDGSKGAGRAASFAARRAGREGGKLILLCVVDWSPYEVLTPREMGERHGERQAEIDEAMTKVLKPLAEVVEKEGAELELMVRHGHPAETVIEVATECVVDQVFTGRRGRTKLGSILFGSVSGALVQACPVPVTVVP